jgi:predicted small secreted protein
MNNNFFEKWFNLGKQYFMKQTIFIFLLAIATLTFTSCNKNYYSGAGKGSNCGCPSKKGMSGY